MADNAPQTGTKVPFTVRPNEPMVMEVDAVDGKRYAVSVRVVIVDVVDTGQRNPEDQPVLSFQAQLLTDTKRL